MLMPISELFDALKATGGSAPYMPVAVAAALGFVLGRYRSAAAGGHGPFGAWRLRSFQNAGEGLVSRVLLAHFHPPDYHLMNHVTLRMHDGTTQIDHILVSRFGVFVLETKDYNGWIFAHEADKHWTTVHFRLKFKVQNPIRQNFRHVLAVQRLLESIPRDAITSVVVICGKAEFKTVTPVGVVHIDELVDFLKGHTVERMTLSRMQCAVGRLETARMALSGQTDVEHVASLRRRFGGDSA